MKRFAWVMWGLTGFALSASALRIESTPIGAQVYLYFPGDSPYESSQEVSIGSTPFVANEFSVFQKGKRKKVSVVELAKAKIPHYFQLRLPGYASTSFAPNLQTADYSIRLLKSSAGSISTTFSSVTPATVEHNGKVLGMTPLTLPVESDVPQVFAFSAPGCQVRFVALGGADNPVSSVTPVDLQCESQVRIDTIYREFVMLKRKYLASLMSYSKMAQNVVSQEIPSKLESSQEKVKKLLAQEQEKAQEQIKDAQERMKDIGEKAEEKMNAAVEKIQEKMSGTVEKAQEHMSGTVEKAEQQIKDMREKVANQMEPSPERAPASQTLKTQVEKPAPSQQAAPQARPVERPTLPQSAPTPTASQLPTQTDVVEKPTVSQAELKNEINSALKPSRPVATPNVSVTPSSYPSVSPSSALSSSPPSGPAPASAPSAPAFAPSSVGTTPPSVPGSAPAPTLPSGPSLGLPQAPSSSTLPVQQGAQLTKNPMLAPQSGAPKTAPVMRNIGSESAVP